MTRRGLNENCYVPEHLFAHLPTPCPLIIAARPKRTVLYGRLSALHKKGEISMPFPKLVKYFTRTSTNRVLSMKSSSLLCS